MMMMIILQNFLFNSMFLFVFCCILYTVWPVLFYTVDTKSIKRDESHTALDTSEDDDNDYFEKEVGVKPDPG